MTTLLFILLALAVVPFLLLLARKRRGGGQAGAPKRRRPLTPREQTMYNRLAQCMPDHCVLAQVAFSALLTSRDRATRNTYNRKVADFVVCSRAFEVLAVIELDDKSHEGRSAIDANRDALLSAAGYRVLRYASVPDVMELLRDFQPQPVAAAPARSLARA